MPLRDRLTDLLTGSCVLLLTLVLIIYAEQAFEATVDGLKLFATVVFPSLLPFFIISELLYGTGMVHLLGVLFEPLMRPLFNVPGIGSFVLSMGLAAGYPMDAVLTAKFRREGLCSRVEAERMLAFSNTADPLFIFGAVAVAMFDRPWLGAILAGAHYAASFGVGLVYRFHGFGRHQEDWCPAKPSLQPPEPHRHLLRRALAALEHARREDGRGLGQILNQAISESTATLIKIMSFIVLFSVLFRVLETMGATRLLEVPIAAVLGLLGMSPQLGNAVLQGIFEIDLGTQAASLSRAPLFEQLMVASAIIAWSGLSVHGQVASILTGTDIRLGPYISARLLHALLAGALTLVILLVYPAGAVEPPAGASAAAQAAAGVIPAWGTAVPPPYPVLFWHHVQFGLSWALAGMGMMLVLLIAVVSWNALQRLRICIWP